MKGSRAKALEQRRRHTAGQKPTPAEQSLGSGVSKRALDSASGLGIGCHLANGLWACSHLAYLVLFFVLSY